VVHETTAAGEQGSAAPAPDGEPDPESPRDPVALAAADVKAILAGALGLRRVVELAAESVAPAAPDAARPDE
jgi:hypothetical protein